MRVKIITLAFFVLALCQNFFAQAPANDNCAGAIPITLGSPPPCGTGLQVGPASTVVGNITNATPGNPYIYQSSCSGASATQSFPANDVWYSFVATGYQAVININSSFATPNVAFYSGSCAALGGGIGGCAVGSGGAVSLTVNQMVPGTTYFLQVSGATGEVGTFTMNIKNNKDCADCLISSSITVNPLPVNGAYPPNTTVNFCFHVGQYNTINTNWLHGVQLTLGSGWNAASIVPNVPAPISTAGTWSYYPTGIGVQNGQTWGPGWYFDFAPQDGNPKNNFGDSQGGTVDLSTSAQWNFCMAVTTNPVCSPGSNLSVTFNTSGDGESGSWSNAGCAGDSPAIFNAIGACCPPNMTSTPANCNGTNTGSATATPVGSASPYTFNWAGPAGYTYSATNVPAANTITNAAAGVYTVTVIDNNLCATNATVQVTQPTAVTLTPTFTNAGCSGNGTGNVSATGGTAPYTYTWSPTGGNGSSASLPAGSYTVTVADSKQCIKTATYNIISTGTVSAAFSAPTPTQCITGNSYNFNAADASGTHTYNFSPSAGSPAQGLTANYGPVSFTTPGSYTVTHIIVSGVCTATTTTVVVVNPVPTPTAGSNSPVCLSNAINLSSGGGATYSWSGPNGFASAAQNPTIPNAAAVNAGVYTVTVTVSGCTGTANVNVVVTTPTTSASNTGPYCQGTTIQLNTPVATTYSWSGPSGYSSSQQNPAIAGALASMAGSYSVLVSFGTCTASAVTNVTVFTSPTASITTNGPVCVGQTINFTGAGGTTYQWFGPAGFNSSNQNPSIAVSTPSSAGVYTLTVTDANTCTNTTTQNLIVNSLPNAVANNATVCEGATATLGATGGISYSWSGPGGFTSTQQNAIINPAIASSVGQYSVLVTDANTCTNTAVAVLSVIALPTPTAYYNGPVCLNSMVSFSATGGNTFSWNGPNNFSSLSATPSFSSTSLGQSGIYTVTAVSGNNCAGTTTLNVVINPLPTATLTGADKGCAPFCSNMSCTGSVPLQSFDWNFGNGLGSNGTTPINSACYTSDGIYTVNVVYTDLNGCKGTAGYTLEVYPKPVADFNYTPGKPIVNNSSEISFTDASYGATITNWNWFFMNTNQYQSTAQNPIFVYGEAGSYQVGLIVKSDKGCMDTLLKPIVIGEDFGIWIPNTFTPNGDGVNDFFQPKGYGIVKYNMSIFDRWGEKIFTTNNFGEGWDGIYNGRMSKDDVYVWKIVITNVYNVQKEYVGHVNLLK